MRSLLSGAAASLIVVACAGGVLLTTRGDHPEAAGAGRATLVVVELFSSEGCSSCPPADAYLAELERAQGIPGVTVVALEEHVDYWDDLGWRDPFSQALFSTRQRQYAAALPDHRVYTPEIVIDGHAIADRSAPAEAARVMRASGAEAKAMVALVRRGDRIEVDVSNVPASTDDGASEVWLAITERGLATRVERGENAGRTLAHAPVVRALRKLGIVTGGSFHAETQVGASPGWNASALRAVVFVQRSKSRRIIGAATS